MIIYDIELESYIYGQGYFTSKIQVDEGAVFINRFDEELDVGLIVIPISTRKKEYQRLDNITITVSQEGQTPITKYYIISQDEVEIVSKYPELYKHNIHLIERTKKLERFLCSTLTFTQPTDGSVRYTVLDALKRVRDTTPFEKTSLVSTTRIFNIPSSLDPLDDIELPQLFLKELTLREALNVVGTVINAIPRLEGNDELSFDYFNYVKSLLTNIKTVEYGSSQDIDLYTTSIESYVRNAIMEDRPDQATTFFPSKTEYIHITGSTILETTEDVYFQTEFDISNLLNAYVIATVTFTHVVGVDEIPIETTVEMPIKNFILEKKRYDLLTDEFSSATYITKRNAMCFEYGDNKIRNAFKSWQSYLGHTGSVYDAICLHATQRFEGQHSYAGAGLSFKDIYGNTYNGMGGTIAWETYTVLQEAHIRVEYIPIIESRVKVEREDISTINKDTNLLSNQQDQTISLDYYLNNLNGIIQRSGNDNLTLHVTTTTLDDIIEMGDYFVDENGKDIYICEVSEITCFNDFVLGKYQFTKNFNRLSEFIGLNNEIRQYEIPVEGKTFERNLHYSEYVELDFEPNNEETIINLLGKTTVLNCFDYKTGYDKPVTSARFIPIVGDETPLYCVVSSNGDYNTLLFSFGFINNQLAGNKLEEVSSKWTQKPVRYTNNLGELDNFKFTLVNDAPYTSYVSPTVILQRIRNFPTSDRTGNVLFGSPNMFVWKDPSEVLKVTFQLTFVPNYTQYGKIIVGRYLARNNNLVTQYTSDNPVKNGLILYASTTENYGKFENTKVKGSATALIFEIDDGFDAVTETNTFSLQIDNTLGTLENYKSWAIGDASGKLYLAVNQDENPLGGYIPKDTIYFNFLNKRRGIILGSKY